MRTRLVLSHIDRQASRIDGIRTSTRSEHHLLSADDSPERRRIGRLAHYFDTVIARLDGSQRILIFGPAEARGELRRRLAANKHDHRAFGFEAAGKMTSRQIAAKTIDWLEIAGQAVPLPHRRSGRPARGAR